MAELTKVTGKNIGCIVHKKGDLRLEEVPIQEPGPGEVQLAMQKVGICGSDVHFWVEGSLGGDFVVRAPMLLGHESCGTVTKVGDGVQHLKPGDRVAIEPGATCRKCEFCKGGRYNLCRDVQFLATPPVHGSLAHYHVHLADLCFKLPDHVSDEEGALLEPLSVSVQACRRAGISLGHNVLVCGAGPIGLVNLMTAKAMGAAKVVITDISENRLKTAAELGADATLMVANKKPEEVAAQVAQLLGGLGPQRTIECSGAESSIQTAILATRSGGVVVLVGIGPGQVTVPMVNAAVREVDIRGVWRYANCYPTALEMVASGKVDVKQLITHRYKLEEALEAFETARTGAGGAIKVMIDCKK